MKLKAFSSVVFLGALYLFSANSFAKEMTYNCTLNKAFDQKSLAHNEVKNHVKVFSYNATKEVGKNIELPPYKLLLWKKDKDLNVKFIGGEFKKPLSIQFALGQEHLRFHYGAHLDFECSGKGQTDAQKALELSADKEISQFQEKLKLVVTKELTFVWNQPEENQMMRTLFFQNGKIFIESSSMEQKMPWCSLRVQLKRNEDTAVKTGESFTPVSFQKQENNTYFTTFSYSFVDFSKGKKTGEQLLYSPFMFSCNILRGMPYKLDTFKSIVGEHLGLQSLLQ